MSVPLPDVVLWDLDGTLVDSREDIAAAGNVARRSAGLPPLPVAEVATMVGDGMTMLLRRLLEGVGGDRFARAEDRFVAHYRAHCCDRTAPYPGVGETLDAIAASGVRQGVVTNKPEAFAQRILEATGLSDRLAAVQGGDGPRKPAPDGILAVCRRLGCDPAEGWMVGDHHTDLLAGRAAGCRTAFVTWGIGHVGDAHPDARIDHPDDLRRLLGLPAADGGPEG